MSTLIYSPGIKVYIATMNNGIIDVSDDIEHGDLTLNENTTHSLTLSLSNQGGKYSEIFTPNDRVVVQMKRLQWVQVMSGFLTKVPYFTVWPRSVEITADCTLKQIKYHYWNPQYAPNIVWLNSAINSGSAADVGGPAAGGLMNALTKILTDIIGWDKSKIHIGSIPPTWFSNILPLWNEVSASVENLVSIASPQFIAAGLVNGTTTSDSATTGGSNPPDWGGQSAPAGCQFPIASMNGTATEYNGVPSTGGPGGYGAIVGDFPLDIDPYWSASGWTYYSLPRAQWGAAQQFLKGPDGKGLRIVVTNPSNGKQVIVRAADFESAYYDGYTDRIIDLSPTAFSAISDSGGTSEGTMKVMVAWAADVSAQTGPTKNAQTASGNSMAALPGLNILDQSLLSETAGQPAGQAAALYALQQVGKPYVNAAAGPGAFDCSGLVMAAWNAQSGYSLPHNTVAQFDSPYVEIIDMSQIQAGDLLFVFWASDGTQAPSHVAMYVGNGQVVEAANSSIGVVKSNLVGWSGLDPAQSGGPSEVGSYFMGVGRVLPQSTATNLRASTNKDTGPVTVNPNTLQQISTGLNASNGPLFGSGGWDPTTADEDPLAALFSGSKLLLQDTSMGPMVSQIASAGMRSYCSAPNGDFIAWFPDYFGQYGYATRWHLSSVEAQDFQITWSDSSLKTHEYTAGPVSTYNNAMNPTDPSGVVDDWAELNSFGVATIDLPGLISTLTNVQSSDQGVFGDVNKIYEQFGPRPNFEQLDTIMGITEAEFWYAVSRFMYIWASQFTATVELTFMPELYPGMLLCIDDVGFQAYIHSVHHHFDLGESGGFSTSVSIIAPSATNGSGLVGLAKNGPQA